MDCTFCLECLRACPHENVSAQSTMNETETTARARAFVLETTGIDADPDWIQLTPDKRSWKAFYGSEHFLPDKVAASVAVDGGEYIVIVDDQTGEASSPK
jgi:formate hydrogenlyase subunit 6/NADH:ubiquinone oxidoreductase subunit I